MHKLAHTLALIAAGAAIAGCGISNPYQHTASTTTSTSTPTSTASSPAAEPGAEPRRATRSPAASPGKPGARERAEHARGRDRAVRDAVHQLDVADARRSSARARGAQRRARPPLRAAGRRGRQPATARSRRAASTTAGRSSASPPAARNPKQWVIVTREQTGGNSQYDGLQASYHVTLAELAQLNNGGWTVSEWLPQV